MEENLENAICISKVICNHSESETYDVVVSSVIFELSVMKDMFVLYNIPNYIKHMFVLYNIPNYIKQVIH